MELYDEYTENNNIDNLIEFSKKTFPQDGTDKLFIGCVLILFSISGIYKPRYFCTRENLLSVVLLAKEKVLSGNLLAFYVERVNQNKGISKYLNNIINNSNLDKFADLIISYLEQFKFDFVSEIRNHKGLDNYIMQLEKNK